MKGLSTSLHVLFFFIMCMMLFFGLNAENYALHILEYFDWIGIVMVIVFAIYLASVGNVIWNYRQKNSRTKLLEKEITRLKAKMFDLDEEVKEQKRNKADESSSLPPSS